MAAEKIKAWLRVNISDSEFGRLQRSYPEYEFRTELFSSEGDLDQWLAGVEVIFTEQIVPDELVTSMDKLRWLHVTRGGAAAYLTPHIKSQPIAVTSSRGIHGSVFSEFAFACMLMFSKRTHEYWDQQQSRQLEKLPPDSLAGKVLVIVGLGVVGTELARRAKCFGMRVLATKRNPEANCDDVDRMGGPDQLLEFLSEADFVVLAVPSIESTAGLIGERELNAMPARSYLINLTGGNAIEENVLARALSEKWIRGAALDAYPRQPMPSDSPLWGLPDVLITPRVGGLMNNQWECLVPIFEDNLRRYADQAPLANVVDKEFGY